MATPFLVPYARVVDVGASVGNFTVLALKKGCVVTAFEADPRVVWTHQIPLGRLAIGATTSADHPVYGIDKTAETSLYRSAVMGGKVAEVGRVSVARLDDVVGHADLIKVDVQGAECDVLQGAQRLLETCPAWVVECWPLGLKKAGSSAFRLFEQFTDAGLTVTWGNGRVVTRHDLDVWVPTCRSMKHANWLATR